MQKVPSYNIGYYRGKKMYYILRKKLVRFMVILFIMPLLFASGSFSLYAQEDDDMTYFNNEELDFLLGEKDRPWNYPTLSLSMLYFVVDGVLQQYMPYQTGFVLAVDQGIHHFFEPVYKKKSALIPGIRIEFSYNIYGDDGVYGMATTGGLQWMIPFDERQRFQMIFSALAGFQFMRGVLANYNFSNDAPYFTGVLGFNYEFSQVYISLLGRFNYLYDELQPLMSYGGSFGVGYRFETKRTGGT